jgi:hypothetical protein
LDVIGMVVKPLRSPVYIVEGAADLLIFSMIAVKSADVEPVDDPREADALAEGAVNATAAGEVPAVGEVPSRGKVEGDGLSVAEPHGEVRNRRLL